MKFTEIVLSVFMISLFSALFANLAKPTLRMKAVNDKNERILNRDIFISESFKKICSKKSNVLTDDFSKWLGNCRSHYRLDSIRVQKIGGVKDKKALWKVEWDGKESFAVCEEL